jgi:hypothetical protein
MNVKGNQEKLRFAIFDRVHRTDSAKTTSTTTKTCGHGRIEIRTLTVLPLPLGEDLGWPGARQIGAIRRVRICKRTGEILSDETVCFITSLAPEQADAATLLKLAQGHWTIENKVHYVRDVTMAEDASQLRKGSAPQVMAAFRNLVLSILRWKGFNNIALAFVHNAANPLRPLSYLLM